MTVPSLLVFLFGTGAVHAYHVNNDVMETWSGSGDSPGAQALPGKALANKDYYLMGFTELGCACNTTW